MHILLGRQATDYPEAYHCALELSSLYINLLGNSIGGWERPST